MPSITEDNRRAIECIVPLQSSTVLFCFYPPKAAVSNLVQGRSSNLDVIAGEQKHMGVKLNK